MYEYFINGDQVPEWIFEREVSDNDNLSIDQEITLIGNEYHLTYDDTYGESTNA